jgi:TatA/E family protein of Tat protein translocase
LPARGIILTSKSGSPIIRIARVSRLFTGGFEFIFVLFIAFLLFGPKKLPEIARVLGKGLGELRRASNELRNSLEDEIRNLDREVQAQRESQTSSPLPPYTREHQAALPEASSSVAAEIQHLDPDLEASPKELTGTENGNNHPETASRESGA